MPEVMRVRLLHTILDAPRGEDYPVFVPKGSIGTVDGIDPKRKTVTVSFGAAFVGPRHGTIETPTIESWQIDVSPDRLEFHDTIDE